jgi:hypothetical protein
MVVGMHSHREAGMRCMDLAWVCTCHFHSYNLEYRFCPPEAGIEQVKALRKALRQSKEFLLVNCIFCIHSIYAR